MKSATSPIYAVPLCISFGCAVSYTGGLETWPMYVALLMMLVLICLVSITASHGIAKQLIDSTSLIRNHGPDATEGPVTEIPKPQTALILAAIVIWLIATSSFSLLPGTTAAVGWVIAAMPLAYFSALIYHGDGPDWGDSIRYLAVIAMIVMTMGIAEFLLLRGRPFSVFQDVNVLAAFCNAFVLPTIARLHQIFREHGAAKALTSGTAGFLFLSLACLAATASRGGHLSFAFGMLALSAILVRHDRSSWKTLAASVLLFVALLAAIEPFQKNPGSLTRLATMEADQSTNDRMEMLKSTWRMVEDGPWYGTGLGTYKVRYLMYRSPDERSTTGDLAHNDYLQMLAEGGPVLLGILMLLALSVGASGVRLWRSARSTADSPRFIEAAGLVGALLCLFGHAALNFIFYVMPLAMIAGLYLGRLDVLRTDVRTFDLHRIVSRPMLLTLIIGLGLWLTATLGLQSVYHAMTTGQCDLRMCRTLSGDEKFYGKFSSLLAATQPSYLPAREWLVNAYTATANNATDDAKRIESAKLAAKELSDQIREFPALPYVYRDLASLILKHPEAASAVPADIATNPATLLTESVRRNPLDTTARTMLATQLEAEGKTEQAFALLFDDGMRWWKVKALPDSGRLALLRNAIPLAVKLGRCADAAEMAEGISAFIADDPLSKADPGCMPVP